MKTDARIVLDSISPEGVRVTTMELTFHRFVLAEVNTHRVMSKNSASSRAIPVEKILERVVTNPAWPISWPCEQPGMQGGSQLEGECLEDAQALFYDVHDATIGIVDAYLERHPNKSGRLHKSVINRLMEPFMWHTALVTSVLWENFFALRNHKDAQPEFQAVAALAESLYRVSLPKLVDSTGWHIPYGEDLTHLDQEDQLKISAARCARVSTRGFEGEYMSTEADLALYEKLVAGNPIHSSPLEHQCSPLWPGEKPEGNLPGWIQWRHLVEFFHGKPSFR